jgi:hypothetical protein
MMQAVGELKAFATDAQSRHYERNHACKRGRLDNFPFSRTERKPTAVRSAVGLSGAGRMSGRASNRCDTMDATSDSTKRVVLSELIEGRCFQCAPARTPPSPLDGTPPEHPQSPLSPLSLLCRLAVIVIGASLYGSITPLSPWSKPVFQHPTRIVGGESW